MTSLYARVNDAVAVNPPAAQEHITTHGSDWYWAVFAVMLFSTIVFWGLSLRIPRQNRIFHYITIAITGTATIAYFSMASDLGATPIDVEFRRSNPRVGGVNRQVFYVRYIDWFITTPLLLLDILLTAALPWPTILFVIFCDLVMVVTGLVGALVKSSYKWGYFAIGCVAFFFIVYDVVFTARKHTRVLGADVSRLYTIISFWTIGLWFLYPISWGLCEGGNVISSDSEGIFYGILDVFAKPIFGAILLFGHRNIDPARLGLTLPDSYATDPATGKNVTAHEPVVAHNNGTTATSTAPVV